MRLNLKCLVWLLVSRSMIRGVVLARAEQAGDKHFLCKSNDNAAPDSLSVCPSLPCHPPLTITLCKNNNLANLVFQHPTVRQKVVTLLRQDRFSHNENPSWKYFQFWQFRSNKILFSETNRKQNPLEVKTTFSFPFLQLSAKYIFLCSVKELLYDTRYLNISWQRAMHKCFFQRLE